MCGINRAILYCTTIVLFANLAKKLNLKKLTLTASLLSSCLLAGRSWALSATFCGLHQVSATT